LNPLLFFSDPGLKTNINGFSSMKGKEDETKRGINFKGFSFCDTEDDNKSN
jgi:hypothetical protein